MSTPRTVTTGAVSSAAPASARPAERVTAVDVFRGLAITEVVLHHVSSFGLRQTTPGSLLHSALEVINRTLHFAVPGFLFLSAAVLTRSLLKSGVTPRYFWRRLSRGGWPYLLWSLLYGVFMVAVGNRDAAALSDPGRWQFFLQYGKAAYHLYFLLVALETYLILPLLLPLARLRPGIWVTLGAGLLLQLGLLEAQRRIFQFQFPGSTALWYVAAILVGVAVGAQQGDFRGWWRRWRVLLLALGAASLALWLPVSLAALRGESVSNWEYNGLNWTYTTLMALLLYGSATSLAAHGGRLQALLGGLGRHSLPVYLIHPAMLYGVTALGWTLPGRTPAFVALLAVLSLACLALPWLVGRLLAGTRLSLLLFGR